MNVIVANEKSNELSNLDIDVIKSISGIYDANELVTMFKNFFYDKMILDITAIKDYKNISNIEKIANELGSEKLILFLNDEVCTSQNYLSDIITVGIYNFTNNINAIKRLIDKPNTYDDVSKMQKLKTLSTEISNRVNSSGIKVLGIKNVTDHAGASTLIYMLKNELSSLYGENSICAIEVDKKDLSVFNDNNMYSVDNMSLESKVRECSGFKFILIDLNECKDDSFCDEVIYLIEPSTIMLNKLVRNNRNIFDKLRDKKLVLNKSLLNNKDVTEFEYESNSVIFYNLPPLDDRKKNPILSDFLLHIGIGGDNTASKKEDGSRIFGLFKH